MAAEFQDRPQLHPTFAATPAIVLLGDGQRTEEYPTHRVVFVADTATAVEVARIVAGLHIAEPVLLKESSF